MSGKKNSAILLGLSLFSFFVTCFGYFKGHTLYWDSPIFFSLFRDNLHALNKFGEWAWWFPHRQSGWPAYYYSILGDLTFSSPVEMSFAAIAWILGKLGFIIQNYYLWYLFYIGWISPLIVSIAIFIFARQIFRSKYSIYYCTLLAAFSPGVVVNISDPNFIEPAAYSLFFASAFLRYFKTPSRSNLYILGFTCCLLAINLNFPFLFWNVIGIPLFVGTVLYVYRKRIPHFWNSKNILAIDLIVILTSVVVCAVPNFIVYSQTGDLIRSRMGSASYSFFDLYVGNPLELLSIGWPRFGFDLSGSNWKFLAPGNRHICLNYLGLLSIPLIGVGLIQGSKKIRTVLFIMIVSCFAVICLSAYSPIFATLLAWPSPLQSNNHFGDAFFRCGGYLIMIFAATFGLETLLRKGMQARNLLTKLFVRWSILIVIVVGIFLAKKITYDAIFGFVIAMAFFFGIALSWLRDAKTKHNLHVAILSLLTLCFIDISTVINMHFRETLKRYNTRTIDETPAEDGIGLQKSFDDDYASTILMYRPYYEMKTLNLDPQKLPYLKFFSVSHLSNNVTDDFKKFEDNSNPSLGFDSKTTDQLFINDWKTKQNTNATATVVTKTFNTIKIHVNTQQKLLLFIRDAYSPYWKASVGNENLKIFKTLGNFKAVIVPAGESEVSFNFKPPKVSTALGFAYLVLLAQGAALILTQIQKRRRVG